MIRKRCCSWPDSHASEGLGKGMQTLAEDYEKLVVNGEREDMATPI